ncbi:DUF2093 domain-containing protein [Pseudahrensia aquimaris]|uniref:DUF2093 domain-containing protein n=1 Tax=Pseudahrensia aquimaris TaxID=744461 RepID=A0ABW3FCD9_9HYPH
MLKKLSVDGPGEAKIRFLESGYQVLVPGTFVRCAVTGKAIPLDELKYWSFDRQEAYIDVEASFAAEEKARS